MKKFLKALPLPACGVMLGLAALGNLLQAVFTNIFGSAGMGDTLRYICGALSSVIWIALVLKLIVCSQGVKKALTSDPIAASVFATFPMGTILLAGYAKPFIGGAARIIWFAAVILHAALIVWFTLKYMVGLKLERVFASYFIVYVGIAASSITAPAFGQQAIGQAAFWFAFISLLCLLVPVTMRYVKIPVKEPAQPLFCIYTAPTALCIAGYIQSVANKSAAMVAGMLALSSLLYVIVLIKTPSLLKLKFYPSYAAFTFPFAITAIAAMQSMAFFKNAGWPQPWLRYVVIVETVIAVVMNLYAFIKYVQALPVLMKQD